MRDRVERATLTVRADPLHADRPSLNRAPYPAYQAC